MADRRQEMLDLVAAIHQHEAQLMAIGQEIERVRNQLSSIRNRLSEEVYLATDRQGSRIYTDDQMRRAEVALRMDRDDEARALRGKLAQLQNERSQVAEEINHLRDRLKVLRLPPESD